MSADNPAPAVESALTENERRFVEEYLVDHNATRSYFAAFGRQHADGRNRTYCSAKSCAHDLLKKPYIKAEIKAAEAFIARRNRVTADRVVRELAAIAFADVGDVFDFGQDGPPVPKPGKHIPHRVRKAILSIKHETKCIPQEGGDPIEIVQVEYKFHPKMSALDKLYEHLGMGSENEVERLLSILPEDLRARVTIEIERAAAARSVPERGEIDPTLHVAADPSR
jgi:phage terminase small subunit